jgi:hypothetical protein
MILTTKKTRGRRDVAAVRVPKMIVLDQNLDAVGPPKRNGQSQRQDLAAVLEERKALRQSMQYPTVVVIPEEETDQRTQRKRRRRRNIIVVQVVLERTRRKSLAEVDRQLKRNVGGKSLVANLVHAVVAVAVGSRD